MTGTMPWEWRNARGRSRRMAGQPSLTAWPPLPPPHWLRSLGWNKHSYTHRAQDEQGSHTSPRTLRPSYPVTHVHKQTLCMQVYMPNAEIIGQFCSFSNFSLVKWSTCWSCFFNLPDIEAITTSLSAFSQPRKPIKPRKKHKLQTVLLRQGPGCLQAVSYSSHSFQ